MKKIFIGFLIIASLGMIGCTGNQMAKQFGGSITETLPKGQKLVNMTWKENNLWILTRPALPGEVPVIHTFKESSSFGIVEGKITVVEQ